MTNAGGQTPTTAVAAPRGSTYDRMSAMTDAQRGSLSDQFSKSSKISTAEPIAVVGIGCRFPGGVRDARQYWDLLMRSEDAVVEVPADRWDADAFYDPDPAAPGRMPSKWGGFLDGIAGFDAEHFGIAPREAETMDPQQRVLLEVAWEALENAGLAPNQLDGLRASVMMGVYYNEYQSTSAADPERIDAYSATGNAHSVTVGRIAYLLGLRGPAVAVDTACSSSLVSVHLACQSLRSRESDVALAGGVSLILRPETQLALGKWGMLSPRGRCNAFDAEADGFVRGEGCGVVVLKRLTDAVRDDDRVLAVIRGSATNQDGRSNGLTAPNAPAQSEVIKRALGDVPAASVHFVESHGTGTSLGDPIEFDALAQVYGAGDGRCAIGAVKTNFGHLEAAAGIAGFIKSVLAVHHGQVPPNLHFTRWNPAIDPRGLRLYVPTEPDPWPAASGPRRAAVSSFGLGGTNAHIVLEQGDVQPRLTPPSAGDGAVHVLSVGAASELRVRAQAAALAHWLDGRGAAAALGDVAHTLARQGEGAACTGAVAARNRTGAIAALRALGAGEPHVGVTAPGARPRPGVVFAFSGQGSQWAGMARQLLVDEPDFAAAVDRIEADFVANVGFSLRKTLESGEIVTGIDRIQPLLVGVQLALADLWRAHGVTPDAVIGHSMGEVTAAVVAGGLSRADGLRVIATRSRLMRRDLSGQGAMALLELDAAAVEELLAAFDGVSIAVIASPRQTVVAGSPSAIDDVIAAVSARNLLARRVEVDVASHHATVDPILAELRSALDAITPHPPAIPVLSTVWEGQESPVFDADYWVNNLRRPVAFAAAAGVGAARYGTIIEVSPHPILTHALGENRADHELVVVPTLLRDEDDTLAFRAHRGRLESALPEGRITDVAPRAWQHQEYWTAAPAPRREQRSGGSEHPLLGTRVDVPLGNSTLWRSDVGLESVGWLADHRVQGQPIMPAAGFAEIALAAGRDHGAKVIALDELAVEQMLPLTDSVPLTTSLTYESDGSARVEVYSQVGGGWQRHATARIATSPTDVPSPVPPLAAGEQVSPREVYAALRRAGAEHDHAFTTLVSVRRDPTGAAEAEFALPDDAVDHAALAVHPVTLDTALQTLAAAMPTDASGAHGEAAYLPVSIEAIHVHGAVGRTGICRARLTSVTADGATGDVTITDRSGTVLVDVVGVHLHRIQRRTVPLPLERKLFGHQWEKTATSAGNRDAGSGGWLVLADVAAEAEKVAAELEREDRRVVTASFDEPAIAAAVADVAADPAYPPAGVVLLLGGQENSSSNPAAAPALAEQLVWRVASTVQTLTSGWHGRPPRLWLVTRDALAVLPDEKGSPAVGSLTGLVRVLAYEHPDLRTTLVDLPAHAAVAPALTLELSAEGGDDLVAWRDRDRYVQRLIRVGVAPDGRVPATPTVRSDGAYIVTGGLGGIGLVVARWLADSGAGRVVLCGRSQLSEASSAALEQLRAATEVEYVRGDIADPAVADALVRAAEATGLRLRGVIHSAAVLRDELVAAMSTDALSEIFAPKAAGAAHLDAVTRGRDLDWWVLFSSVASMLGSPGQGAYAAANAYLDALAQRRRADGETATSICWGQWAEVGLAQSLDMSVLDPMLPAEGTDALGALVGGAHTRVGVARLRLDRAASAFPELSGLGYFAQVVGELEPDEDAQPVDHEALRGMSFADARDVVLTRLQKRIGLVLGYSGAAGVAADRPLTELGLDSLMAVRIRNAARGEFGFEPPVALLLQGATLTDLATDLVRRIGVSDDGPTPESAPVNSVRARAQQRVDARRRAVARRKADHI